MMEIHIAPDIHSKEVHRLNENQPRNRSDSLIDCQRKTKIKGADNNSNVMARG